MTATRREIFGQVGGLSLAAATSPAPAAKKTRMGPIWIDGLSAMVVDEKGLEALAQSSLSMFSATVGTALGPPEAPNFTYDAAVAEIARWHGHFAAHPDRLLHVRSTDDIIRAHQAGQVGVMINFQNSTHLNRDLRNLKFFYDLGLRQIQLTYNDLNAVGAGCTERDDVGLSHFGLAVVEKMNELGIIVDLSHCGPRTTMDAIEASKKPVLFTHTNCRAVNDNPRCKTDEQIRKLAAKGGVVGMTTYGSFVGAKPPVTLDDFMRHLEHAIKVAGIDHVSIGSDTPVQYFQGPKTEKEFQDFLNRRSNFAPILGAHWGDAIEELNGPEKFRRIQKRLAERGFGASDIDKILGGNLLRVYREIIG